MTRRVAVLTSSRAEYGLLRQLLLRLEASPELELQLVVTGTHMDENHGFTLSEIEAAGLPIAARIDLGSGVVGTMGLTRKMGCLIGEFGNWLDSAQPDILVLLGDRFELLAAAQGALIARVPIAHIHGGEVTEGAFDDAVRHALTKLAHLHFVATEQFAARVRQMGEESWRIHVVGALGLDELAELDPMSPAELSQSLRLDLRAGFILATCHPETIGAVDPAVLVEQMIGAIDEHPDLRVIVTAPNIDPGSEAIRARIEAWSAEAPGRVLFVPSLGHRRYLSALRQATMVVGNSSSGIIEAPTAGTPTVNIGGRQDGRPRAASVIDVEPTRAEISAAIDRARLIKEGSPAGGFASPYGRGHAAEAILESLSTANLGKLLKKRFIDLP